MIIWYEEYFQGPGNKQHSNLVTKVMCDKIDEDSSERKTKNEMEKMLEIENHRKMSATKHQRLKCKSSCIALLQ